MAKVNITEAAKLAGITRQYLHKKYISTGKISVEKDEQGKNPQIDTAEILRVFGKNVVDSNIDSESGNSHRQMTPENDSKIAFLEEKLRLLSEQLTAAQEREKIANERENRLMNQIDQFATTIRLLEHKPVHEPPKKKHWWSFS